MSEPLTIHTLGGLRLQRGDVPVTGLASRKAAALLVYLACTGRAQPREALADLLWDDRPTTQALGNLRVLLTSLRQQLGPHLTITRHTVAFDLASAHWLDVAEFEGRLSGLLRVAPNLTPAEAAQLAKAVDLYAGDFLQGVYVREGRGFEEWALLTRERLRQQMTTALHTLVAFYLNTGDYATGQPYAQRLLELDPLREAAHRQLMELLARQGHTAVALAQYDACVQVLQTELGVAPEPETTALQQRLLAAASAYRHNLPPQATPFIGRVQEVATVTARLGASDCRWLTLVGPGGVGKTRLALQVAEAQVGAFLHGVFFVSLAAHTAPGSLLPALAEALRFTPVGRSPLVEQLHHYLRGKELLLVLDNFETVLADSEVLPDLLRVAPGLKLLVTSRERLGAAAEWLWEVAGLPTTAAEALPEAVQLFIHSARRVQPTFALTPENAPAISRICELLQGLPLGLELAAAWIRTLSCAEIAQELERGVDFLASPQPGAAKSTRHRNLQVVFDYSWQRLGPAAQTVFASLCCLPGGFQRAAAEAVAGATLADLRALTDQSLLTRTPTGRYVIHEYVRQLGAAQPQAQRPETLARLAAFSADFLQARAAQLHGAAQSVVLDEVGVELENLRLGWAWAVDHGVVEMLHAMLDGLGTFLVVRGRYQEGWQWFAQAEQVLAQQPATPATQRLRGRLLAQQAQCGELSAHPATTAWLTESVALLREAGAVLECALPLRGLGYQALLRGEYAQATAYLEESCALARAAHNPVRAAAALNTLVQVVERQGDYARARALCEEGLALRRQAGNPLGIINSLNYLGLILTRLGDAAAAVQVLDEGLARCEPLGYRAGLANLLNNRANAAYYLGDYAVAAQFTEKSLALCRDLGDEWGEAIALNNLGYMAAQLGAYAQAQTHYHASLAVYQRAGIQSGQASTLANLGLACLAMGETAAARAHLRAALAEAQTMGAWPVVLKALSGWAQLLPPPQAMALAHQIAQHPATEPEYRALAQQILAAQPGPVPETSLDTLIEQILAVD